MATAAVVSAHRGCHAQAGAAEWRPMVDRERLVRTFLELVAIDSPSGHEDAMAEELVRRFRALAWEAGQDAHGNVVARRDGVGEPVLLSAHMDTVEPGRGIRPAFDGPDVIRSDGTTILGADDKAGCAVILEVAAALSERGGEHRPVEVAITRGEEIGLVGARHLDLAAFRSRVAIVIDGGGPPWQVQGQAPFHYTYDVEVHGRGAHAGVEPEKGVPAITIAAELVTRLPQGRLDGETTANVGRIAGGTVRNAVPDLCRVEGEFRSMNQAKAEGLVDRVRAAVAELRAAHPEARIDLDLRLEYPGYTLDDHDPAVQLLFPVLRSLGMEPQPRPIGGGTDGNILRMGGIASVVIGRGGYLQHTKEEYLVIPEMVACAQVVEAVLRQPTSP